MSNLKYIPGFEGQYKISKHGDVLSYKTNDKQPRMLKSFPQMYDYDIINLASTPGKLRTYMIHTLVMMTYGPARPSPHGDYVCTHLDKNKKNNHISNLQWILKKDVRKRPRIPIRAVGIDEGDIISFRSVTDTAKYFHTNQQTIRVKIRQGKPFKGYIFTDLV